MCIPEKKNCIINISKWFSRTPFPRLSAGNEPNVQLILLKTYNSMLICILENKNCIISISANDFPEHHSRDFLMVMNKTTQKVQTNIYVYYIHILQTEIKAVCNQAQSSSDMEDFQLFPASQSLVRWLKCNCCIISSKVKVPHWSDLGFGGSNAMNGHTGASTYFVI